MSTFMGTAPQTKPSNWPLKLAPQTKPSKTQPLNKFGDPERSLYQKWYRGLFYGKKRLIQATECAAAFATWLFRCAGGTSPANLEAVFREQSSTKKLLVCPPRRPCIYVKALPLLTVLAALTKLQGCRMLLKPQLICSEWCCSSSGLLLQNAP